VVKHALVSENVLLAILYLEQHVHTLMALVAPITLKKLLELMVSFAVVLYKKFQVRKRKVFK